MTRDEHLRRMYAMGTTGGTPNRVKIACSACSKPDIFADGLNLAAIIQAADAHIAWADRKAAEAARSGDAVAGDAS